MQGLLHSYWQNFIAYLKVFSTFFKIVQKVQNTETLRACPVLHTPSIFAGDGMQDTWLTPYCDERVISWGKKNAIMLELQESGLSVYTKMLLMAMMITVLHNMHRIVSDLMIGRSSTVAQWTAAQRRAISFPTPLCVRGIFIMIPLSNGFPP